MSATTGKVRKRTMVEHRPVIDDDSPGAQGSRRSDVVRDQQDAGAGLRGPAQSRQDKLLGDNIERRGRLVRDQESRTAGKGLDDAHPLPLTTGEFHREAPQDTPRISEPDLLKHRRRPRRSRRPGRSRSRSQKDRDELTVDAHQRVKSRQRILADSGNTRADPRRQKDALTLNLQVAAGPRASRERTREGRSRQRFARTGRPDQCHDFTGVKRQRHIFHHRAVIDADRKALEVKTHHAPTLFANDYHSHEG